MTYKEAKELFFKAAEEGRVPIRSKGAAPGACRTLTKERANQVLGRVELGVAHASGKCGSALDDVEISPLLLQLDDLAWHGAEHLAERAKAVVVSDARLFASTILGRDVTKRNWIRVTPDMFEPAWRSLAEALLAAGGVSAGGRSKKTTLADLHRLAKAAAARGILRPEDLPPHSEEVMEWAQEDPWDSTEEGRRKTKKVAGNLKAGLVAYRRARRALGERGEHLTECLASGRDREWGIGSLEGIDELLRRGFERLAGPDQDRLRDLMKDPGKLPMLDKIAILAPDFGDALRTYLDSGDDLAVARQPLYEDKVVHAMSRLIAMMFREKIEPAMLEFDDLWRPVDGHHTAAGSKANKGHGRFASTACSDQKPTCLLHHLTDVSLPYRIGRSTLQFPQAVREGRALHYPDSAFNDARAMKYVAARVLRPLRQRTGTWNEIEAAHTTLMEHMSTVNENSPSSGRIDKSHLPINFGQLLCVILWDLRQRIHAADRAIIDHQQNPKSREGSHRATVLQERLYKALEEYAVVAVIAADGLRVKNYAGAIAGVHVIPTPVVEEGEWVGFSAVRTHWRGDDCPSARLKITKKRRNVRERTWILSPGIVDLDLFFRYWTEVRPNRLRKAGLIGVDEQMDFAAELAGIGERFALFASDLPVAGKAHLPSRKYALVRSGPAGDRRVSPGNRTDASVRDIWARVVHRVARDLLRVDGLPATLKECRKGGNPYRGLMGPHGLRSLAAWHFGGLLNRWSVAMEMTNDSYDMLHDTYAVLPDQYTLHRGSRKPEDPELYVPLVDWMFDSRSLTGSFNWEGFWAHFRPLRFNEERQEWVQLFRGEAEEVDQLENILRSGNPLAVRDESGASHAASGEIVPWSKQAA